MQIPSSFYFVVSIGLFAFGVSGCGTCADGTCSNSLVCGGLDIGERIVATLAEAQIGRGGTGAQCDPRLGIGSGSTLELQVKATLEPRRTAVCETTTGDLEFEPHSSWHWSTSSKPPSPSEGVLWIGAFDYAQNACSGTLAIAAHARGDLATSSGLRGNVEVSFQPHTSSCPKACTTVFRALLTSP